VGDFVDRDCVDDMQEDKKTIAITEQRFPRGTIHEIIPTLAANDQRFN
jgi:hypothetical protein